MSARGKGGGALPRRPAARPGSCRVRGRPRVLPPLPRDPRGFGTTRDEARRRGRRADGRAVPSRVTSPLSELRGNFVGRSVVDDPPKLLVSDAAASLAATLSRRLVVFLDRDRPLRHVRDREIG